MRSCFPPNAFQKMPMRKLGLALLRSRAYPFGWEKDYPAGYDPVPEKPGTLSGAQVGLLLLNALTNTWAGPIS